MKMRVRVVVMAGILLAVAVWVTSCSSDSTGPSGEVTTAGAYVQGVPGGTIVNTYHITAKVTAINAAHRKVTVLRPDGTKATFKAGPDVINFDQIRVGDRVKATLMEELIVSLRDKGTPRNDSQTTEVALAPKGAKPGAMMANTVEVTAKVRSVDLKRHTVTLQFPNGESRTFPVRPDVDLTKASLGQEVVICATETTAIRVEKP